MESGAGPPPAMRRSALLSRFSDGPLRGGVRLTVLLPLLAVLFAITLLLAYAFEPGGVLAAEEPEPERTYEELLEALSLERAELGCLLQTRKPGADHPLAELQQLQARLDPKELSLRELNELVLSLEATRALVTQKEQELVDEAKGMRDRVERLEERFHTRVRRSEDWLSGG